MRSRRPFLSILLLCLPCLALSCKPAAHVTTAREFIANYSNAMLRKDAKRVLAMEADGPLMLRLARDAAQREKLARFDPDQRQAELERLFKEEDMWWKAWSMTRYVGEREHGDHLDVEVVVSSAYSQVILVRADDGSLRLHPMPGWVHAEQGWPAAEDEPPADEATETDTPEE